MTRAWSASAPPSARPTSTCPAIASASSTSARKTKSWKTTWLAASAASLVRARTALATANASSSDPVRTTICAPMRVIGRMQVPDRAAGRAPARAAAATRRPRPCRAGRRPCPRPSRRARGPGRRRARARGRRSRALAITTTIERRAQVADAAQPALPGEREQRARQADRRDAQVARRGVGDRAVAAEQVDDRRRERRRSAPSARRRPRARATAPARRGRPPRSSARRRGAARPAPSCRRRGSCTAPTSDVSTVAASASAASSRRPEMADDRGVREQVQRLGRERAERGQGDEDDLAVVDAAAHDGHARSVASALAPRA